MKLKALGILLVFVPALSADAVVTCNAGAASVPVFDVSSVSGAVGDYTLDCTGGTPTPPGQAVPEVNVFASLNVPVLDTGGWILTDGVNMTSGALLAPNEVEFLDVPLNPPGAGHLDFEVENTFVNPSLEPPGFEFIENMEITGNVALTIESPPQLVAVNAVPEPSFTLLFAGVGLGAMWLARKMHHSK
jgi:hypothetical protein